MNHLGMISAAGTIFAFLLSLAAFLRSWKKESQGDGAQNAVMLTDIGYIKSGNDNIKGQLEKLDEKQERQYIEVMTRLTAVEQSAKQAHHRIDEIRRETT